MQYYFRQIDLATLEDTGLSGFAKREVQSKTYGKNELKVSLLWFKNNTQEFIFITIDTLYIPKEVSSPIYTFFSQNFALKEEQIIFNASHTHSAPAIEKLFDKKAINNSKYISYIIETILNLCNAKELVFQEGEFFYSYDTLPRNMIISRRRIGRDIRSFFLKKKMLMLPHTSKKIDESLTLFGIKDKREAIKVLVYSFSCHPVFNKNMETSSDFIGKISSSLKDDLGIKTMFLQGFLGDIRPAFTTKKINEVQGIQKLKLLFNQEVFKSYDISHFNLFTQTISQKILKKTFLYNSTRYENDKIKYIKKEYIIYSQSAKSQKQFFVKYAMINQILFISIPAEVTSSYALNIREAFPQQILLLLGLADGIIGYLPFYDEVEEGGYEVNSALNYGWDTIMDKTSLKDFYTKIIVDIEQFIGAK